MNPFQLETLISYAKEQLEMFYQRGERAKALFFARHLPRLIAQRIPATVDRMEAERGLA